jgi:hypothetical protein
MKTIRVAAALLFAVNVSAAFADVPAAARTVQTVRAVKSPIVDGDLSDAAWSNAPEITGFIQHDPNDETQPTEKTIVKVVYDDGAIYIGAHMIDSKPVTTLLGRRDNSLESDWFRVWIDSQHDRLSGAGFWVNPSNVQVDMNLYNDIYDDWSWDAVWQSEAKLVPDGWVVEIKIPFSQLRFQPADKQTWGINFARFISRNQEVDRLVNVKKGDTGWVSRFADLSGIEGVKPERALEIMPYGVARSDLANRITPGDPFTRPTKYNIAGGLDVKYALTSTLRLTGTINPDFGQVEVDPAVINLSDTETFFPEKRPFFTEGANIFSFGNGPANFRANFNFFGPSLFYSRRIGRPPQGSVDADFVDSPTDTTILGAAKLSGKLAGGWSIGVLDALTSSEKAKFAFTPSGAAAAGITDLRGRQTVEPLSNYFVARSTKEYGNSRIGVLLTNLRRDVPDELSYLRSGATALGVDGYTLFHKKDWLVEWQAAGTKVDGSAESIRLTQLGSAHYYQRPDTEEQRFDPNATSLSGFGGRAMLGKRTGKWRTNVQVSAYTPGYETNDVGFMPRADAITSHAVLQYNHSEPSKHFRSYNWWISKYQNWNWDRDLIANGLFGSFFFDLKNYWYIYGSGGPYWQTLSDRKTRGGPLALTTDGYNFDIGFGSDSRKKVSIDSDVYVDEDAAGGWSRSGRISVVYRPKKNLTLSVGPSYSRSVNTDQYVTQQIDSGAAATYGKRYVFAALDERQLQLETRVDWTLNARLSLQLYLQPFIATGDYSDFKKLDAPRTRNYTPTAFSGNPDFNFRSLRGSAVARWEFRPGSALYVVWNENRADVQPFGDFSARRDLSSLRDARSKDVFLVKVSYWLPM